MSSALWIRLSRDLPRTAVAVEKGSFIDWENYKVVIVGQFQR